MVDPLIVFRQVETLTSDLIGISLCNDQNFPLMETMTGGITRISFANTNNLSIVLKNVPYSTVYHKLRQDKAYNLRMIDGALIQMMYRFQNNTIVAHRLAFFPSPDLLEFQNNAEIYGEDDIYADVVMKNIVTTPIRFDFDLSDNAVVEIHHPSSHLTIGQYTNCRIPVSAPVTPFNFINFILRNFYNTAHRKFSSDLTHFTDRFLDTITLAERNILHIHFA